ncbi:MAG: CFI-box-CTERM domain-containing protein [Nitrososphaera sp.]
MKRHFVTLTLLAVVISASSAVNAYGHGLGQDQAVPVTIAEKRVTVEAIIRPASIPFPALSDTPTLLIRTYDANSNVTIAGIDYSVVVELRNETLLEQRFRSSDGTILANLIPDKDLAGWLITGHESAKPGDQIEISLGNPIELRSGILVTGGLYHITVTLEKGSKGLALQEEVRFDLYVSVSHAVRFKAETLQGEQDMVIKTYYDDVTDFSYLNGTITFVMPFNWDRAYVNQVSVLHMEVQFPKSVNELRTNSYSGTLSGAVLPADSILIDDYTSEENRVVHFVVSAARLSFIADSIDRGSDAALFSLKPAEKPNFPLDLVSAPRGKYLFQLAWGPDIIETGMPITFVMNLQDPGTGDLSRHSYFDFVVVQNGNEVHRQRLSSDFGAYSHEFTFSQPGTATLTANNINGEGERAEINLVVLQGTNPPPQQPSPQPSGCLIATAAFGSELAPQVQYLRDFRDHYILSTTSGSSFMSTFNSIYYSFSPQVADYERKQPWLQATVKAALYPLFGILMAAERSASLAGGEVGAVLAGTTASALIGCVYFLPAGIAASKRVSARMLLFAIASSGIFLAATILLLPAMLPLSTSAFVLAAAGASAIMLAKIIIRLYGRRSL